MKRKICVFLSTLILAQGAILMADDDNKQSLSIEVGVMSNYLDEGYSLSDDKPSAQIGIEYRLPSNLYIGYLGSYIDDSEHRGAKNDVYAGYAFNIMEDLELDMWINHAMYTIHGMINEDDISAQLSYKNISIGHTQGLHNKDDYNKYSYNWVELGFLDVANVVDVTLHGAIVEFDKQHSYFYALTLSKDDVSWAKDSEIGVTFCKAQRENWSLSGKDGDKFKVVGYWKYNFNLL